jgi:hypothetical protein
MGEPLATAAGKTRPPETGNRKPATENLQQRDLPFNPIYTIGI